jgi:hypothetical protein
MIGMKPTITLPLVAANAAGQARPLIAAPQAAFQAVSRGELHKICDVS